MVGSASAHRPELHAVLLSGVMDCFEVQSLGILQDGHVHHLLSVRRACRNAPGKPVIHLEPFYTIYEGVACPMRGRFLQGIRD